MTLKPTFATVAEMGFAQIGESWTLAGELFDTELGEEMLGATATLTIMHAGGEAIVTDVAMTVTDAELSYTLANGALTYPERGCQAALTITLGSDTWTILHVFDAVRFSPRPTLAKTHVAVYVPNFNKVGSGEDPANQEMIREAWRDVLKFVKSLGQYPQFWLDADDLRSGHLYRALELIHGRNATSQDAMHALQSKRFHDEFENWKTTVKPRYDADDSGTLDESEQAHGISAFPFGRRER